MNRLTRIFFIFLSLIGFSLPAYADKLAPVSAIPEGELQAAPVNLADIIRNKTVTLAQPWRNTKRYKIKEHAIFFDENGYAHSASWLDVPWTVNDNLICMQVNAKDSCYQAFEDSTNGQAYLLSQSSDLLAQVKLIDDGDSQNMREAYRIRQEELAAKAELQMAFMGLLFEAFVHAAPATNSGLMTTNERLATTPIKKYKYD